MEEEGSHGVLRLLESSLLRCEHVRDDRVATCGLPGIQDTVSLVTDLLEGHYDSVYRQTSVQEMLGQTIDGNPDVSLHEFLKQQIENFIKNSSPEESELRQICVMCVGITSLQLFVQANWTGPPVTQDPVQYLPEYYRNKGKELEEYIKDMLSNEEESMYPLVHHPLYLLLGQIVLVESRHLLPSCKTVIYWAMRCLYIKQELLDERSPQIHDLVMELIDQVKSSEILTQDDNLQSVRIQFYLECSYIHGYYYKYDKAKQDLSNARNSAQLTANLTGALGKKTRFQQSNIPQLLLKVQREEGTAMLEDSVHFDTDLLPKDLLLDNDTLLDKVQFEDPQNSEVVELSGVEQAVILAMCLEHKRTQPKQELLTEELQSFIQVVLAHPKVWSIQTVALLIRSRLEDQRPKTIERSMTQMQVLVDQFNAEDPASMKRLYLFYTSNLQPKWIVERDFAELLIKIGAVKTALEVYLRLHLWEDAIVCYQKLGRYEKAENLTREQLKIKETGKLWCILGDVTEDHTYYEKAWEVSNHRSARAQRSLGVYYFRKEDYDKAIEHLQKSLEINSLQYNVWFRLGFAATEAQKYDIAIKAYHRCTSLDSDNFEAWNNLSNAYIKTKQKMKAYRTLQESLKCNYEHWKVWENFLVTSTDVGHFEDVIRAYHRLLDLKQHFHDEEVLEILVKAIVLGIDDANGLPASRLKSKALELLGRQTSQVTNNAKVWQAYANLLGNCQSEDETQNDKALQCMQKAHRVKIQSPEWFKDTEDSKDVLQESIKLAEAYSLCSSRKTNSGEAIQLLSSGKLMLKQVITKVKQTQENTISGEMPPELLVIYQSAEEQLQKIIEQIQQKK